MQEIKELKSKKMLLVAIGKTFNLKKTPQLPPKNIHILLLSF